MCDVVLALHVERIEREVEAERLALRIAIGINGGKATLPDVAERVAEFVRALESEPATAVDDEDAELLRVMRLAG